MDAWKGFYHFLFDEICLGLKYAGIITVFGISAGGGGREDCHNKICMKGGCMKMCVHQALIWKDEHNGGEVCFEKCGSCATKK